ncbi:MAG: hypothetical protein RAK18_04210 [Conexivisphaerales archaeon]|nr:hypothetical protein [Conexivisphaerales archaeon]
MDKVIIQLDGGGVILNWRPPGDLPMEGTTVTVQDLMRYIIWREGCAHPFRISRSLVLANWRALAALGKIMASFGVDGFEAGFAVPEIEEIRTRMREGREPCVRMNEERKCLQYVCSEPVTIPREYSEILDHVLEETRGMDDVSLNRLVIRDPRYRELLTRRGFR